MSRLLTALTVLCLAAGAFAGPGFDDAFWGEPIAVMSRDSTAIPVDDVYAVVGDETRVVFYAQIPSSIIAGWIADPSSNNGLAFIPQAGTGGYYNNDCFFTYMATWRWEARPKIRMDGWWTYPDQMAVIRQNDPTYMYTPNLGDGNFPDGQSTGQHCGQNARNVLMLKWSTNLSGNVPGEVRTLSWGCNWSPDGTDFHYDVYVAPEYWDEGWITYEDYVTPVPQQPGDANVDGLVNDADLAILLANWAGDPKVWGQGNFNTDTAVNDADLAILLANWGFGVTVPEPASLGLLVLGLGLIRRRR